MDETTQRAAASSEEAASASEELSGQAAELNGSVVALSAIVEGGKRSEQEEAQRQAPVQEPKRQARTQSGYGGNGYGAQKTNGANGNGHGSTPKQLSMAGPSHKTNGESAVSLDDDFSGF
jgi:hypothetical protein